MSIQPRFLAHKLTNPLSINTTVSTTPHTIDLYLDYVCPYSSKMFNTVYNSLMEAIAKKYPDGTFTFVFRQVVQPWHPSSTLVHEAAIAAERLDPTKFWAFSNILFQNANDFYDTAVYNESRAETYERLATLASETVGVDKKAMLELLTVPPSEDGIGHNIGNPVTNDLKLFVRQHRTMSVHVTPTVAIDGIVNNDFSSSWTADQWLQHLDIVYKNN
ncbi:thioredoxin-like protein [Lipomyces arxii]|uniref:thioredoxin-like protein n=1 Tax=Lipomyces arxii TaxID=56418 RepID=UPI0034CF3FE1